MSLSRCHGLDIFVPLISSTWLSTMEPLLPMILLQWIHQLTRSLHPHTVLINVMLYIILYAGSTSKGRQVSGIVASRLGKSILELGEDVTSALWTNNGWLIWEVMAVLNWMMIIYDLMVFILFILDMLLSIYEWMDGWMDGWIDGWTNE